MFTIISFICAIWLLSTSFLMKTKNVRSTLVFKFIPFILGALLTIVSLDNFGIITVNF